jgi:type I restriction enzyme S subunit
MKRAAVMTPLEELMATRQETVDPSLHPSEVFELLSIPAYHTQKPEVVEGAMIGSAKKSVKPGDVLLSRIVPHIRRAWVVPETNGYRQIASGEWIVFRSNKFNSNYLRHLLMSDVFHTQFMSTVAGVGGSLLRARPAFVEKITIPLPPLPEQKRIADILDKADALRRKRRAAIQIADSISTSLFDHCIGDPLTNRKGWDVVAMGDLFAIPPNYGTMIVPSESKRGWLDLRVANIQNGILDLSDKKFVDLTDDMIERHEVRKGDLLLARAIGSQEHLGKCFIADPGPERWAFDSHLMRIRFDTNKVEPCYVHAFLSSSGGRHEFLRNSRRSAVQFNINTKEMAKIQVPLPPLSVQATFVAELDRLRVAHRRQEKFEAECTSLFTSLVQRAFDGEL